MTEKVKSTVRRDVAIDLIKTIAILGVIVIHTYRDVNSYPVDSAIWLIGNFFASIARASVPLFLMCSGVLFLNEEKEISIKRLYSRNMLRILASLFFWASLYKVIHLILEQSLTWDNFVISMKEVLLFNHETHFYFLHIILLVYALVPILRAFVNNARKTVLEYSIIAWFVLGILLPAIGGKWPFNLVGGIPAQWPMNLTYCSIGYFILGKYLRKYPLKLHFSIISAVLGFVYTYGATIYSTIKQGSFSEKFINGNSVGVCFLAIGIFGICCRLEGKIGDRLKAFLELISRASFCIYLVHPFAMYCFYGLGINVLILPAIASIPLLCILVLAVSVAIYLVLSCTPIVKKWLI